MKKIELEIIALSHSITQTHSYAVVLGEVFGQRRLPIVIGGFEAQAIAVALEKMNPSRPLTHDLMKNIFHSFSIELVEIIIHNLEDGIFYSKLICTNQEETMEIDSRTSDALALAVRFGCPIYTYENIMESASLIVEEELETPEPEPRPVVNPSEAASKDDLQIFSIEDLQKMLDDVLEKEDYIKAAAIRDEINRRK